MLALINRILDWFKSIFWKEEMELTLVGLQYSGKTTFVNVIAVSIFTIVFAFLVVRWWDGQMDGRMIDWMDLIMKFQQTYVHTHINCSGTYILKWFWIGLLINVLTYCHYPVPQTLRPTDRPPARIYILDCSATPHIVYCAKDGGKCFGGGFLFQLL